MTAEEQARLAAIHARPDEVATWLEYADWFDRQADPREEFLRAVVRYHSLVAQVRLHSATAEEFDRTWWVDPPPEVAQLRERIQERAPLIDLFWLVKLHRGWTDNCAASPEDYPPCPKFRKHNWSEEETHYGYRPSEERWCAPCLRYVWYCFSVAQMDHQIWPRVDQEIWPRQPEAWHSE